MRRSLLITVAGIAFVAVFGESICAYAQPAVLPSERLSIPGESQAVFAGVYGYARSDGQEITDQPDDAYGADENLAHVTNSASAQVGSAHGWADLMVTAWNPIAVGATDFVPQTDTTANADSGASGYIDEYGYGDSAYSTWALDAFAQGTFRVVSNPDAPGVTNGELRANIHLVANGGESGSSYLWEAILNAYVGGVGGGGTQVTATYDGYGTWTIEGFLEENGGPGQQILEYSPLTLNHFYLGTRAAQIGNDIRVDSSIGADTYNANSTAGGASQLRGFSADAWYSIH